MIIDYAWRNSSKRVRCRGIRATCLPRKLTMSNLFCFDTCFDIHGNVWQQVTCAVVCWEYFRSKGRLDLTLLFRHRTSSMSSLLGDVDLLVKLSIWHNYIRTSSHLGDEARPFLLYSFEYLSPHQQGSNSTIWPINASLMTSWHPLVNVDWKLDVSSRAGSADTVILTSLALGGGNFLLVL